jgi:hypothetical protein
MPETVNDANSIDISKIKSLLDGVTKSPEGSPTGAIVLSGNAGKIEADLMVSSALRKSVTPIIAAIPLPGGNRFHIILKVGDLANQSVAFQSLSLYRIQEEIVRHSYSKALSRSEKLFANLSGDKPVPLVSEGELVPEPAPIAAATAIAGIGLNAASKLFSFFQSDFTFQGLDILPNDNLLLMEVARGLRTLGYTVVIPDLYDPDGLRVGIQKVAEDLSQAEEQRLAAEKLSRWHKSNILTADSENVKEAHQLAIDHLDGAVSLHASFVTKLTATDGALSISAVAREIALEISLNKGAGLLMVKAVKSGGSLYTEKNLWTLLGRMPFFVGAGVIVSFALLDGRDGRVLASGQHGCHGGFSSPKQLSTRFEHNSGGCDA